MDKVALFGVYDHVTGHVESIGCFPNYPQAARVLVAMYAFSPNPAVSKRLADYDIVQITDPFDPLTKSDEIKHIFLFFSSLEKIKQEFDRRDGVFMPPFHKDDDKEDE